MVKRAEHSLWILALCIIGSWLSACSSTVSVSNSATSEQNVQTVEIDDPVTPEEMVAGLKKAKFLLLSVPFLTAEERSVQTIEDFKRIANTYLEDPRAATAVQNFYVRLLQLPANYESVPTSALPAGATCPYPLVGGQCPLYDRTEPANLAGYLFSTKRSFKEFVTADYCVDSPEQNFAQKPCVNRGVVNNVRYEYTLPPELRAGFITTQAWLDSADGALNFRRANRLGEQAFCQKLPASVETVTWNEAPNNQYPNLTLHPFYWTSRQPPGAMDCTTCHALGGLNQWRVLFTSANDVGSLLMGQQVTNANGATINLPSRTINDVESALILNTSYAQYGDTFNLRGPTQGNNVQTATQFEPNQAIFLGEDVAKGSFQPTGTAPANIREYAHIAEIGPRIANHPSYSLCVAQRFFQFAMRGEPMSVEFVPPPNLHQALVNTLEQTNFDTQALLLEILSSPAYLNK